MKLKDKPYTYKLRPGYNSKELLIEFTVGNRAAELIGDLNQILIANKFHYNRTEDLWMNDEVLHHFSHKLGSIIVSVDIYDSVFILGNPEQAAIIEIDIILDDHPYFTKEKISFDLFK